MGIKKGDYVLTLCHDLGINVGRAKDDENEDGEFDLEHMDGGIVSPGNGEENVVVSEKMARFFWGCMQLLPSCDSPDDTDNMDDLRYVPEDVMNQIILVGKEGYKQ